ncbi:antibiotic biosynthesis monooxygenase family protein [Mycobacteroides sp. LB1]|uniref:antibiotic biosynthesis monooxygenase family protein n=1 Tax=Mycobacteroides sp. LB1 TaxID=2750814 RepID=UPI0015DFE45D|nr:antibiotic biosynthesis monooxygenase [Mycobacteroides sp. LB1]
MSEPIVFINVFEVAAEKVDAFLAGWRKRAEFMTEQPGFLSFRIHRAVVPGARFQLVNIATWESIEALTTATSGDRFQAMVREAAAEFGAVAYPAVYEVALEM